MAPPQGRGRISAGKRSGTSLPTGYCPRPRPESLARSVQLRPCKRPAHVGTWRYWRSSSRATTRSASLAVAPKSSMSPPDASANAATSRHDSSMPSSSALFEIRGKRNVISARRISYVPQPIHCDAVSGRNPEQLHACFTAGLVLCGGPARSPVRRHQERESGRPEAEHAAHTFPLHVPLAIVAEQVDSPGTPWRLTPPLDEPNRSPAAAAALPNVPSPSPPSVPSPSNMSIDLWSVLRSTESEPPAPSVSVQCAVAAGQFWRRPPRKAEAQAFNRPPVDWS